MRSRTTLMSGALLAAASLTAVAGLSGGAADAAHAGHAARHTPYALTGVALDVAVTSTKGATTLSTTSFAPGNTIFDLSGKGEIEIVSFKPGYGIGKFSKAAGKLFQGNVKVVRKIDKKVVFWGGAQPSDKSGASFGVYLPAGNYYAINLNRQHAVPFTVTGTPESRPLPMTGGHIKMVQDMTFHAQATLPHQGWITIKNKATEPHFVVFAKLKKGTGKPAVRSFLMSGAEGQPSFVDTSVKGKTAGVASPGHSFVYDLDLPKGEYAELCFWPSNKTGLPHALMGMFDISQLS